MDDSAKALAGNRWHMETGHFEDILLKGHFTKIWAEVQQKQGRVQFSSVVRVGVITPYIRRSKGKEVRHDWRESCVDRPPDRKCGPWPPSRRKLGRKTLTSLSTILWVCCRCLPLAKLNWKAEFEGSRCRVHIDQLHGHSAGWIRMGREL